MADGNVPEFNSTDASSPRTLRGAEDYLQQLAPETRAALNPVQLDDIRRVIGLALPNPAPKVLDIRFGINLLFARYFVVFFMGKERRRESRSRQISRFNRVVNAAIAICLVLSMNVFVSLTVAIALYLIKSAMGIDLFDNQHLSDQI